MKEDSIKKVTGLMAILLPFVVVFAGLMSPYNNRNWWHSLSASYYNDSTATIFYLWLFIISILLLLNKGLIAKLQGISLWGILLFPAADPTIPIEGSTTGVFNLNLSTSDIIHSVSCFVLLALIYAQIILFMKSSNLKRVYKLLLSLITFSTIAIITENGLHAINYWDAHWTTIITESLLFIAVGYGYYIKGVEEEKGY